MSSEDIIWRGSIGQVLLSEISDNYGNQKSFLLRIADFNVQQKKPEDIPKVTTFYSSKDTNIYEYRNINLLKNPARGLYQDKRIANINGLLTCVWGLPVDVPNDIGRTDSLPRIVTCRVYEIVSLDYLTGVNFSDLTTILDSLIKGVSINTGYTLPFPFLLQISNLTNEVICFEINNSNCEPFSQDSYLTTLKLKEGEDLNVYRISKDDIISSDAAFTRLTPHEKLEYKSHYVPKRIYRKSNLPTPITIEIKSFVDLLSQFIESSAQSLSKQYEKSKLLQELEEIFNKKSAGFQAYLQTIVPGNFKELLDSYISKYTKSADFLRAYRTEGEEQKKFLVNLVEGIPELKEKYISLLKSDYLVEEEKKREEEVEKLNKCIESGKIEVSSLSSEIELLNTRKSNLTTECQQLLEKQEKIKGTFLSDSSEFIRNLNLIREVLSLKGSVNLQTDSPTQNLKSGIVRRQVPLAEIKGDTDTLDTFSNLVEELQENLNEQGFTVKTSDTLGKIIGISFINRIPLLCVGRSTQKLVDAVSISLIGRQADTFCIPTGFSDYSSLLEVVRKADTEIVVLENIVSAAEEYCYLHLAEDVPEKSFIYVENFKDSLKMFPGDLYSYVVFMDCDRYYKYKDKEESKLLPYRISDIAAIKKELTIDNPKDKISSLSDKISDLILGSPLTSGYVDLRVQSIAQLLDGKNDDATLKTLIISELIYILSVTGFTEGYYESLEESDVLSGTLKQCLDSMR